MMRGCGPEGGRTMKRKRFSVTGELMVEMFKKDIIFIENQKPLPSDAKLLKVDVNRNTNTLEIEYLSDEVPEIVEGAGVEYSTFTMRCKSFFKRVIGK
jgi:hypothetical protein